MSKTIFDDILKSSLEYYDSYQPKVSEIISKTEYIMYRDNKNITDEIIFFDKNKKKIFESSFEFLAVYVPSSKTWKWAWSLPSSKKKNNFISRKILEYAFSLEDEKDFLLKTTLINSKIRIINDLQLDLYTSLSASLSRKPFILKTFLAPLTSDEEFTYNGQTGHLLPFRKINEDKNRSNYITLYLFILDFQ